jgi:His-Xaa-Ser system radical SAM maturase HxsB
MTQIYDIKNSFNFFRFKKFDTSRYLLTNDTGNYIFLEDELFEQLKNEPESLENEICQNLVNKCFINQKANENEVLRAHRKKFAFLAQGPSLHIIVLTLRCNHTCLYCQTSRKSLDDIQYDMTVDTAEKTVDFILNTTSESIDIEFQGGEPLLNFDILKHIVEYVKAKKTSKNIVFSLVSNLSMLNEDKLKFLIDNDVSICTSLDGPESIHNKYRLLCDKNSFELTTFWIKRIQEENTMRDKLNLQFNRPNALLTSTIDSLDNYKEIIDLYVSMGLSSIFLRPMNPFGYGKTVKKSDVFNSADFLEFYCKSMDYIIELNQKGVEFYDKMTQYILKKIIAKRDPNYVDLRSPCGAGLGQLAYNYDGNIFTCDEGRMVYEMGDQDDSFLLGNTKVDEYGDIIRSETLLNMCVSSCLEGLPGCNDCVYNPYCGVCPVYNFIEQGNIFGQMPISERCKILIGIHDYIFLRLESNYDIFISWVNSIK